METLILVNNKNLIWKSLWKWKLTAANEKSEDDQFLLVFLARKTNIEMWNHILTLFSFQFNHIRSCISSIIMYSFILKQNILSESELHWWHWSTKQTKERRKMSKMTKWKKKKFTSRFTSQKKRHKLIVSLFCITILCVCESDVI